jgi:hypothetical protein
VNRECFYVHIIGKREAGSGKREAPTEVAVANVLSMRATAGFPLQPRW